MQCNIWKQKQTNGRSRGYPPPQRDPILSFSHTFPLKSTHVGGCPPQREILDPPLKKKSKINKYLMSSKWVKCISGGQKLLTLYILILIYWNNRSLKILNFKLTLNWLDRDLTEMKRKDLTSQICKQWPEIMSL